MDHVTKWSCQWRQVDPNEGKKRHIFLFFLSLQPQGKEGGKENEGGRGKEDKKEGREGKGREVVCV